MVDNDYLRRFFAALDAGEPVPCPLCGATANVEEAAPSVTWAVYVRCSAGVEMPGSERWSARPCTCASVVASDEDDAQDKAIAAWNYVAAKQVAWDCVERWRIVCKVVKDGWAAWSQVSGPVGSTGHFALGGTPHDAVLAVARKIVEVS